MRFILTTLALAAAICACDTRHPDRLGELRAMRDGFLADRIRRDADCKAVVVEFASFPAETRRIVVETCLETNRTLLGAEQSVLRDLEIEIERMERARR